MPDGVIGNTTGFGPVILGSSPNRVTNSIKSFDLQYYLDYTMFKYYLKNIKHERLFQKTL